jgi:hypothetical protein
MRFTSPSSRRSETRQTLRFPSYARFRTLGRRLGTCILACLHLFSRRGGNSRVKQPASRLTASGTPFFPGPISCSTLECPGGTQRQLSTPARAIPAQFRLAPVVWIGRNVSRAPTLKRTSSSRPPASCTSLRRRIQHHLTAAHQVSRSSCPRARLAPRRASLPSHTSSTSRDARAPALQTLGSGVRLGVSQGAAGSTRGPSAPRAGRK